MAGEDRFFAGLLLCCGIALVWCARDVEHKRVYIDLLATAFFVGGIGRLLAILLDGPPHPFYVAMLEAAEIRFRYTEWRIRVR